MSVRGVLGRAACFLASAALAACGATSELPTAKAPTMAKEVGMTCSVRKGAPIDVDESRSAALAHPADPTTLRTATFALG